MIRHCIVKGTNLLSISQKEKEILDDVVNDLAARDDLKDTFIFSFSSIGRNDLYRGNTPPPFSYTSLDDVQREYVDGEGFCPCDADAFDELKDGYIKYYQNRYGNVLRKIHRAKKTRLVIMNAHFFPSINMAANSDLVFFFRAVGKLHEAGTIKEVILISSTAVKIKARMGVLLDVLKEANLRVDDETIIDLDKQVLDIEAVRAAISRLKAKNDRFVHMQLLRQELCVEWRTPREWRMQRLVAELVRAGELERTSDPDVFKLAPTVDDGILVALASLKMKGCTSVCIADIEVECKIKAIRCNKEQIGRVLDRLAKDGQIVHVPEENSYLLF